MFLVWWKLRASQGYYAQGIFSPKLIVNKLFKITAVLFYHRRFMASYSQGACCIATIFYGFTEQCLSSVTELLVLYTTHENQMMVR